VTLGYKGRLLADYRFTRELVHTARPEPNAIEHAVNYWNAIRAEINGINETREKAFDQVFSSIRSIQSGDDGFEETVKMTLAFRLPTDITPTDLKERLLARIENAQITFRGEELCYRAEKNTVLVRAFNAAIRDNGGKPGYVYKTGTSDMNIVGPVWKCPIVAYGPGDSSLDHTPEEHIILDEYHKAIGVMADVLRNLGSLYTPQNSPS
jgi:[amino group carrier protein]-lysine/ornithine hydrolase